MDTDTEIRTALHRKKLKRLHACPNTLVVEELGLAHAKVRVDIAVINGCLHGFEIKSASDTLRRLPQQIRLYEECLEKLTIVCAEKHLPGVSTVVPEWCGIVAVTKGRRGAIFFRTIKPDRRNPNIRTHRLASLLWRSEAAALLTQREILSASLKRRPRRYLYERLGQLLTVKELTSSIKEFMTNRQNWRDPQELS